MVRSRVGVDTALRGAPVFRRGSDRGLGGRVYYRGGFELRGEAVMIRLVEATAFVLAIDLCTALVLASGAHADTIHVPGDVEHIQEALDDAAEGDTVLVASGTYFELLSISGKDVVLRSESGALSTELRGELAHPVIRVLGITTSAAVVEGFTISGGRGGPYQGGV